jgi:hypothetical protein
VTSKRLVRGALGNSVGATAGDAAKLRTANSFCNATPQAAAQQTSCHLLQVEVGHPRSDCRRLVPCQAGLGPSHHHPSAPAKRQLAAAALQADQVLASGADEFGPWELAVTVLGLPGAEKGVLAAAGGMQAACHGMCVRLHDNEGPSSGPFSLDAATAAVAADQGGSGVQDGTAPASLPLLATGHTLRSVVDVPCSFAQSGLRLLEVWLEPTAQQLAPLQLESVRATRLSDGACWWFWGAGAWLGVALGWRRVLEAQASDPRAIAVRYEASSWWRRTLFVY